MSIACAALAIAYVVGTPNAAARTLRRLLSLPPAPAPDGAEPGAGKAWCEVELSAIAGGAK